MLMARPFRLATHGLALKSGFTTFNFCIFSQTYYDIVTEFSNTTVFELERGDRHGLKAINLC